MEHFIPSTSGKSCTKINNVLNYQNYEHYQSINGQKYPQFESAIYADGNKVIVTVSRTLSPDHVDLDFHLM